MRRTALLAGAAGVVLALSACTSPAPAATPVSSAARSSASPAPPTPRPSSSPTAGSAEQRYLSFVQQFSPTLAAQDPTVLLTLGKDVCSGFIAGKDADQVVRALDDDPAAPDLSAEDGSVVLGAAVATLCPKYRTKLEG